MKLIIAFDTGYVMQSRLRVSPVVDTWMSLLQPALSANALLHNDTYSSLLDQVQCLDRLRDAAAVINVFMRRNMITVPNHADDLDQNFYNELHAQFERLSGPDWDRPTRLMRVMPPPVRQAIRQINRLCHAMEDTGPKQYLRVEFDTDQRHPITDRDQFDWPAPNTVTADYGTLGKNLLECFHDGLSPDYPGRRIQEHISANFVLRGPVPIVPLRELETWRNQHGSDVRLDKSTLGIITLGDIEDPYWFESVHKTSKINTITLE